MKAQSRCDIAFRGILVYLGQGIHDLREILKGFESSGVSK